MDGRTLVSRASICKGEQGTAQHSEVRGPSTSYMCVWDGVQVGRGSIAKRTFDLETHPSLFFLKGNFFASEFLWEDRRFLWQTAAGFVWKEQTSILSSETVQICQFHLFRKSPVLSLHRRTFWRWKRGTWKAKSLCNDFRTLYLRLTL